MSANGRVSAVIGCGYWGPNIIRSLDILTDLRYVVDLDIDKANMAASKTNGASASTSIDTVLADSAVEMVAVVTPPHSHREIFEKIITSDKHVFVEKPLAVSVADARAMADLALEYPYSVCCVGHTFLFVPEIVQMRQLISDGLIGRLQTLMTYRLSFGKYQNAGVALDLFPHDVSILGYITDRIPRGEKYLAASIGGIDACGAALFSFEESAVQAVAVGSWGHTDKTRKVIAIGDLGTLEFDMSEPYFLKYWKGRDITKNNPGVFEKIEVADHAEAIFSEIRYWLNLINRPNQGNKISLEHGYEVVRAIGELNEEGF